MIKLWKIVLITALVTIFLLNFKRILILFGALITGIIFRIVLFFAPGKAHNFIIKGMDLNIRELKEEIKLFQSEKACTIDDFEKMKIDATIYHKKKLLQAMKLTLKNYKKEHGIS